MNAPLSVLFEQLRLHWRTHFVLSELLLALDEEDDSLRDIHWDARDLMQIRAHILALQHRLHLQIHRLHFRIIFQATSQTLP